jgi:hypothetical protein
MQQRQQQALRQGSHLDLVDESGPSDAQLQRRLSPGASQQQQQQQHLHVHELEDMTPPHQLHQSSRDAAEAFRNAAGAPHYGQIQLQPLAAGSAAGAGAMQLGVLASSGSMASLGSAATSISGSGSVHFTWGSGAVPAGLTAAHSEPFKPLQSFAFKNTNADPRLAALRAKVAGSGGELGEGAAAAAAAAAGGASGIAGMEEEQAVKLERVVYDSITFPSIEGFQQQQQRQQ